MNGLTKLAIIDPLEVYRRDLEILRDRVKALEGRETISRPVKNYQLDTMVAGRIKGRALTSGDGTPEDIIPSQLVAIINTADGTGSGLDADLLDGHEATYFVSTPADNSQLATMAAATIKGRASGAGTGTPTDLTAAQVTTILSGESTFTELVQDIAGGFATDSSTIDFTYSDAGNTLTAAIVASSVANSHLATMAQATVKGRASGAGTGAVTDLTAAQLITILTGADGTGSLLDADLLDGLQSTAFLILAGQSGGQTAYGGTASENDLTLNSTSHATKGYVQVASSDKFRVGTVNAPVDTLIALAGGVEYVNTVSQDFRSSFVVDSASAYWIANWYYNGGYVAYDTARASADIFMNCTSANSYIAFRTSASNTPPPTERMRITKDGYVGIANNAPAYELDVNGSFRLGTANTPVSSVKITTNGGYEFANTVAQNYRAKFEIDSSSFYIYSNEYYSGGWQLFDSAKAPAKIQLTSTSANSYIVFYTKDANTSTSTEQMRITKSGDVGIGSSSPSGQRVLVVPGSTSDHGVQVNMPSSTAGVAYRVLYNGSEAAFINAKSNSRYFYLAPFDNSTLEGTYIYLGRNSNASTGAAGHIAAVDRSGTTRYIWPDNSGNLRIGTTQPINSQDTSGAVVGTQTSWHAHKENLLPHGDISGLLAAVNAVDLYDFQIIGDTHQSCNGDQPTYTGLVIFDHDRQADRWFAQGLGPNQTPVLNFPNLFGHLIGAVQALSAKVAALEARG